VNRDTALLIEFTPSCNLFISIFFAILIISVMVVDSIDTENSSALETSSQEMADVANDQ
jgi:hypothetical protein